MAAVVLELALRARLQALVAEQGERAVLQQFEVGRDTLARAMAGLGVRGVTAALIRDRITRVEANE